MNVIKMIPIRLYALVCVLMVSNLFVGQLEAKASEHSIEIDPFKIVADLASPNPDCSEFTELRSCPDQNRFGFIFISCLDVVEFDWEVPVEATVIVDGTKLIILNAVPGSYFVKIVDGACVTNREFIVEEACCENEITCTPSVPESPSCVALGDEIQLTWDAVPNATGYDVELVFNSDLCDCGGLTEELVINTEGNSISLTNQQASSCFAWRVRSLCDEEEGNYSSYVCYPPPLGNCPVIGKIDDGKGHGNAAAKSAQIARIYPNPSNGVVYFEFNLEQATTLAIQIFDINGQLVKSFGQMQLSKGLWRQPWFPNNDLPNGVYVVNFRNEKINYNQSLVLKRDSQY